MKKLKHLLLLTIILISNLGCESKPKEVTNVKNKTEKNEEN